MKKGSLVYINKLNGWFICINQDYISINDLFDYHNKNFCIILKEVPHKHFVYSNHKFFEVENLYYIYKNKFLKQIKPK